MDQETNPHFLESQTLTGSWGRTIPRQILHHRPQEIDVGQGLRMADAHSYATGQGYFCVSIEF